MVQPAEGCVATLFSAVLLLLAGEINVLSFALTMSKEPSARAMNFHTFALPVVVSHTMALPAPYDVG